MSEGQLEAVLAWMVAGYRPVVRQEKKMPKLPASIEADTLAWRAEEDKIVRYLEQRLVKDPRSHIA